MTDIESAGKTRTTVGKKMRLYICLLTPKTLTNEIIYYLTPV